MSIDGSQKMTVAPLTQNRLAARDARRRTIWVPSDDTTVMTIHPGAQTQTLNDDTIAWNAPLRDDTIQIALATSRRASMLQAPRRAPLSSVKRVSTNASIGDRPGNPTGKENLIAEVPKPIKMKPPVAKPLQAPACPPKQSLNISVKSAPPAVISNCPLAISNQLSQLSLSQSACASEFPVLEQDLQHPELFEAEWLTYQETSLSHVVNEVLSLSLNPNADREQKALGSTLLSFYQQPHFMELRKRISEAVQKGALTLPSGSEVPRLRDDVGLRQRFIDQWLDTYDLAKLQAAAEVVSARQCKAAKPSNLSDGRATRKTIARFLVATLVTCDVPSERDSKIHVDQRSQSQLAAWQTTVIRSLMMIYLLDQSLSTGQIQGCLFSKLSHHKKSQTFLRAIGALILPSIGDLNRTLAYMHYTLSHSQNSLEEYSYIVENLAVDLRDGVVLARLVETLIHNNRSTNRGDTTLLSFVSEKVSVPVQQDSTLSSHLQYPCPTRAQKLFNVQVSLSALERAKGLTHSAASMVTAADIVDGHRERTLALLWAILSRWGLHMLTPTDSLQAEIKRHTSHLTHEQLNLIEKSGCFIPATNSPLSLADQTADLLKTWAAVICAQHGINITNYTTSFASPATLAAIVSTYAACIPACPHAGRTANASTLSGILRAIGCSDAFARLCGTLHIPTKATTLCTLSFLAARLIPLASRLRSVEVLQRAWRARLRRQETSLRVKAMRVARQCADVVAARKKVEWAVLVLQGAWREVKKERMRKAEGRIERFQAAVHGWAVRKALVGVLPSLRRHERIRGGW